MSDQSTGWSEPMSVRELVKVLAKLHKDRGDPPFRVCVSFRIVGMDLYGEGDIDTLSKWMWVAHSARYGGLMEGMQKGLTLPHLVGWRCTKCGLTHTVNAREEPDAAYIDIDDGLKLDRSCPKCKCYTKTETKAFADDEQLQAWLAEGQTRKENDHE